MSEKVNYKAISSREAYEMITEKSTRSDLFFEKDIQLPSELMNLQNYDLDVSRINDVRWFLRVVEEE